MNDFTRLRFRTLVVKRAAAIEPAPSIEPAFVAMARCAIPVRLPRLRARREKIAQKRSAETANFGGIPGDDSSEWSPPMGFPQDIKRAETDKKIDKLVAETAELKRLLKAHLRRKR